MKRKLITLHSDTNDGLFDCNFNDDIIIDKDSHVSFVSCSLTLDNNKIIIDNNNDNITFKIGTAPLRSTRIPHGIYSNDNIGDLIMRIQNSMNQQLDIDERDEHGQEVLITLTTENKIEFKIQGSGYDSAIDVDSGNFDTNFFHKENVTATDAGKTLQRTTNSANTFFDSYVTANAPVNRGAGASLVTIDILSNLNPVDKSGFFLGWKEGNDTNHIDENDLTFYIQAQRLAENYVVKGANGIVRTTLYAPRVGDTVGLVLSQGMVSFVIYNPADAAPIEEQLAPFPYDKFSEQTTDPMFPVLALIGNNAHTKVSDYQVNLTPYATDIALTHVDLVLAGGVSSQPPASNALNPHRYILNFPNSALANDLGFTDISFDTNNTGGDTRTFTITAPHIFQNVFHPDNYKIELLNINLESYDSQTQGRRNILGIIPISESFLDQNISLLQYEVSNLIPLSVRNKNTEALRNIRARLINSHNETATTFGLSFINIMVEYGC